MKQHFLISYSRAQAIVDKHADKRADYATNLLIAIKRDADTVPDADLSLRINR